MTTLEQRLSELRQMAAEYATAESQRIYLEKFDKAKLAILMKEAATRGFESAAAQEREARADPEYLELLLGLKAATETAVRLKWELEIAREGMWSWRRKMELRQTEMQAYRG